MSEDRGTYGRKGREAIRLSDTVHSLPHHLPSALDGCLLIGYVGEREIFSHRLGHYLRYVSVLSNRKLSLRSSGKEQRRDGGRARYRACGLRNLHLSERRALESLSLVRALLLDDQSERGVRREHAFARGKLVCGLRPGGAAGQKSDTAREQYFGRGSLYLRKFLCAETACAVHSRRAGRTERFKQLPCGGKSAQRVCALPRCGYV